jgi:multidrug efflux pump subunit AcrB
MNGSIRWFARNTVAANLLMVCILIAGSYSLFTKVPLEVFPSIELEQVNIRTPFPGSTPAEVEEGVTVRIEEAIQDIEGIEKMISTSLEGSSSIRIELGNGYDPQLLKDEITTRIEALNTLPDEVERPVISVPVWQREVISVALAGPLGERELRDMALQIEEDIRALPEVTQAQVEGIRPYELAIEIPERTLQEFGLTLSEISNIIRRQSLDLSAGSIKTNGGEVLIRAKGQAYVKDDYADLVILSRPDGTRLQLGDIATIKDDFDETPIITKFNGRPALTVEVYRIGDQNAITVAAAVRRYIAEKSALLPEGITLETWRDRSKTVSARLQTLTDSALQGGILVLLLLGLFLHPSIALWVCIGIPVSFMGSALLMPELGVTLNTISLFAYILVLGIVVDDAIVTGENVYSHLRQGATPQVAAEKGTAEVAVPVTFGVLTTMVAFVPLLMVEGRRGAIFAQIPMIVIPVLIFSLIESKWILPAHLSRIRLDHEGVILRHISRLQRRFANGLEAFIFRIYRPLLNLSLSERYLTIAIFFVGGALLTALIMSGWMRFIFFPRIQSEVARATLVMPAGTPFLTTSAYVDRITEAALKLQKKYRDPETGQSVVINILSNSGTIGGKSSGQSNRGRVFFEIEAPEKRQIDITTNDLVREWRKLIGSLPGAESLNFRAEFGRTSSPIDIQLSGNDFVELQAIAEQIKSKLGTYPQVFDIEDSISDGKEELQLQLQPAAETLGIRLDDLARQAREGFFGVTVQKIQRGRDEVNVILRYPETERATLASLQNMMIRTSGGVAVPFAEVASLEPGRTPAAITRIDRNRTLNVTADANKEQANLEAIKADLETFLQQTVRFYPSVKYSLEGEAREQRDSFNTLIFGLAGVLFAIYALLAIPLRSYLQPLIVMTAIPFGAIGAVIGHRIMDLDLTIMSLMGMLALTGVVINDSLVLVHSVNRSRNDLGMSVTEAIKVAGVARFRPVLLTSLTTFAGLTPIIFDKSTQAQFLIPMAVSLGFGVLFATFTTLLVVPVNYLILNDFSRAWYWLFHGAEPPTSKPAVLEVTEPLLGEPSIGGSPPLELKRKSTLEGELSTLSRSSMSQPAKIISPGDEESKSPLNVPIPYEKSSAVSPKVAPTLSIESSLGLTVERDAEKNEEELSPLSQPSMSQSMMFVDLDAEPDAMDYEDTDKIVSVVEDNEPTNEEELSPLSQPSMSQSMMFVDLDAEPDDEDYETPKNSVSMVEEETADNEEELSSLSRSPMSQPV